MNKIDFIFDFFLNLFTCLCRKSRPWKDADYSLSYWSASFPYWGAAHHHWAVLYSFGLYV